jgi:very-short-patch-repair endonuclease
MRGWHPTHRITNGQPVDESKKKLARQMRRAPTPSEHLAWSLLRGRQILGFKFRRQQVILGFIVDFFCAEEKLVLEVDGSCHEPLAAQQIDEERTAILARMQLKVVRIKNEELSKEALEAVLGDVTGRRSHPLSLQGEGDGG